MFAVFEVLMVLLAVTVLYDYVEGVINNKEFEQNYLTRDLSLAAGAAYSVPGDMDYMYPADTIGFMLDFQKGKTYVYEKGAPDFSKRYYPVCYDSLMRFSGALVEPLAGSSARPRFLKTKDSLQAYIVAQDSSAAAVGFRDSPVCPTITTKKPFWDKGRIAIDPGAGYFDVSAGSGPHDALASAVHSEVSDIVLALTDNIFRLRDGTYFMTVRDKTYVPVQDRMQLTNTADIVISIHAGRNEDTSRNDAVAYFAMDNLEWERSQELGCLILNMLEDALPEITGFALAPIDVAQLPEDDPRRLLANGKPSVLIEIGNMAAAGGLDLLTQKRAVIASQIDSAVRAYFER